MDLLKKYHKYVNYALYENKKENNISEYILLTIPFCGGIICLRSK